MGTSSGAIQLATFCIEAAGYRAGQGGDAGSGTVPEQPASALAVLRMFHSWFPASLIFISMGIMHFLYDIDRKQQRVTMRQLKKMEVGDAKRKVETLHSIKKVEDESPQPPLVTWPVPSKLEDIPDEVHIHEEHTEN